MADAGTANGARVEAARRAPHGSPTEANVLGHVIHVEDDTVIVDGRATPLAAQGRCGIHRDAAGRARTVDVGGSTILLIECTHRVFDASDGGRALCRTVLRAVVLSARDARVTETTMALGSCPPFAWEGHVFTYFLDGASGPRRR